MWPRFLDAEEVDEEEEGFPDPKAGEARKAFALADSDLNVVGEAESDDGVVVG